MTLASISRGALGLALGAAAAGLANAQPAPSTTPAPPGAAGPATPQPAAGVTQGATVYDTKGGTVGTVESVDGQFAVVATTRSKVRLPLTSFGKGDKGPLLGMTAAELDAAAAQVAPPPQAAAPAGPPQLAAGTTVNDTSGNKVGTIESVDGDFAVVATTKNKVRLPVSSFAAGASGPVIGMTADQLDQAAAKAGATGG